MWACGAVGSALPWHGRGREFESHQVHQNVSNTYRPPASQNVVAGVQLESKSHLRHGQPWASCGFRYLPTIKPTDSMRWRVWAPWAPFFARVVVFRIALLTAFTGRIPELSGERAPLWPIQPHRPGVPFFDRF